MGWSHSRVRVGCGMAGVVVSNLRRNPRTILCLGHGRATVGLIGQRAYLWADDEIGGVRVEMNAAMLHKTIAALTEAADELEKDE